MRGLEASLLLGLVPGNQREADCEPRELSTDQTVLRCRVLADDDSSSEVPLIAGRGRTGGG